MFTFSERQSFSPTLRSVLAEVKLQADRYGSPIEIVKVSSPSGSSGWLYLFERRLLAWRTGVYEGVLILHPPHSPVDFCLQPQALGEVLGNRSVAALRVFSTEFSRYLRSWGDLADRVTISSVREVMPLADNHGEFLRRLGKHTRRNVQQCRKWAAAEDIRVEDRPLNSAEISKLALQNMPTPKQPHRILQSIRYAAKQPEPFQVSLTTDSGIPFSTAGGYIDDDFAFLIYQANDRRYRSLNPSLMLRSFLIERLIDRGVRYLAFVGGCAGVLLHQCEIVPTGELVLVRKTMWAGLKHRTASALTDETNRIVRLAPHFV